MQQVYAIVVAFNGMQWIGKCLHSLESSSVSPSIIVVDSHSNDGTPEFIREKFPRVGLIEARDNLGFGKANNTGILRAMQNGADYFFLLNQDAWVDSDTIRQLIDIHQKNTDFGIVSPMHLNADRSALDHNFSRYISPDHCPGLYSDLYLQKARDIYAVDFVNAAAWLLTWECVQKTGLFDPVFFHYGEDRNYSQRVWYHGFKVGVCPGIKIVHDRDGRKGVARPYAGRAEARRLAVIDFCDIRAKDLNRRYFSHTYRCLRKGLFYFATGQFAHARAAMSDFRYFVSHHEAIQASRRRNKAPYPLMEQKV